MKQQGEFKKRMIRFLLPLLALALMFPQSGNIPSLAEETTIVQSITVPSYSSNNAAYSYYMQLDSNQKSVYNALKTLTPTSGTVNISLASPLTLTYAQRNDAQATQALTEKLSPIVQGALDALLKDYPEIFWLAFGANGCGYEYSYTMSGGAGQYRYTLRTLTFSPVLLDSYQPVQSSLLSTLNNALADFSITGSTRYEKLKSIHDGLAARITYDTDETHDRRFDAYGALIDGLSVCEGYAESFKLLCDRAGIPCILVVGTGVTSTGSEGHMWNAVQMDDGKWYGVDVTWDDVTWTDNKGKVHEAVVYDFFLVGTQTKDTSFGRRMFAQSHVASGFFSNASYSLEFVYPTLSATAYVPGSGITTTQTTATIPTNIEPPLPSETTTAAIVATTTAATTKKKTTQPTAKTTTSATKTAASSAIVPGETSSTTTAKSGTQAAGDITDETTTDGSNTVVPAIIGKDGFPLPLWTVAAGVAAMLLLVLAIVLLTRRSRKPRYESAYKAFAPSQQPYDESGGTSSRSDDGPIDLT